MGRRPLRRRLDLPAAGNTTANLNWNVYRDNRAGNGGGGMFCDDGATCVSYHEVYDRNCGGNIFLDSGSDASGPTIARFDHLTNVGALDVGCKAPGAGVRIDKGNGAADDYSFVNAIFWGNAPGLDFVATCDTGCGKIRVNVSHSMVQTQYRTQNVTITFGDGHHGAGRSAVRRSGERRLPSEIDGGALDADRLRHG